ncbi:MAG: YHYH protein [Flavobacteriaceae bacterium]|jgi:hypothetical protein|nr:YHYH protein [Flavobacteriaceae bacterium]
MNKLFLFFATLLFISCSKSEGETEPTDTSSSLEPPEVYSKIYGASQISIEGDFVVIEVDGTPDHGSPYFNTSSSLYENYNGDNPNFSLNPNQINAFNLTYKIPLNPKEASNKSSTRLGSMGVALNGVALFNQYAGPNQPLTNEINSFDQYNGHPERLGTYHYHIEPLYLTQENGKDALMGFLLDGFPVYGPEENGSKVTNSDLDAYHGHQHATSDFPEGIYHYHITDNDPYINGNQYFGTPGTVTQ